MDVIASTNFFSAIFTLLCYKNIEKGGTPSHPTRDRNPAVPPYLMHKTFSFLTVIAGVTLYLNAS